MSPNEHIFPEKFLWGSATASYQVEGGIGNCDWAEAEKNRRVPICGKACDHYNRYKEDFDIVKSLNQNAHRFSIEWARIEPEEGKFNLQEIKHYKDVLKALQRRNIEPVVTLWHFTLPVWFAKKGGFESREAPRFFARYSAFVMKELGNEAAFWLTINEPLIFASNGYLRGNWPPFKKKFSTFLRVVKILVKSHNAAYDEIKKVAPNKFIGIAKNNIYFHANFNPINIFKAAALTWFWNLRFLNRIKGKFDFIGLNYYIHHKFGGRSNRLKTDMGWDIYPIGLYHILLQLKRYKKMILVTENGIADAKDKNRAYFIREHIAYVYEAILSGVDVRGYFYWSLLDNYEWAFGFEKRFGLVKVNFKTMKREIRKSSEVYSKIAASNSLTLD